MGEKMKRSIIVFLPLVLAFTTFGQNVYTVNSTAHDRDAQSAHEICHDGSGNCTLRVAIEQANAHAGMADDLLSMLPEDARFKVVHNNFDILMEEKKGLKLDLGRKVWS